MEYAGGSWAATTTSCGRRSATALRAGEQLPGQPVFAFNAEGGMIHSLAATTITVLERFFLGGENSIRGHRYRSIFLRDSKGSP